MLLVVISENINYSHARLETSPWNKCSQFPLASKTLQLTQYPPVSGAHCISRQIKYML